jgi:lysophospholipase L1-like esterase
MRIAFYGDSLTEGKFGVSFMDFLIRKLPSYEFLNYGEGGDTVISLYHRIAQMKPATQSDLAVLWIGVNDVFGRMTWLYRIINIIRKKPYASNRAEWLSFYRATLDLLSECSRRIITIPPLLLSEDLENKWNRKLEGISEDIRVLSNEYKNATFANLRQVFMSKMEEKQGSSYLPTSIIQFLKDKSTCSTNEEVDKRSSDRGLTFTLDGVHLNSAGAEIVADFLKDTIKETDLTM